jgi:hypothetical protein
VTVGVSEDVKRKLSMIAAELSKESGRKIGFGDAVFYLTELYDTVKKNPEDLRQFCTSISTH